MKQGAALDSGDHARSALSEQLDEGFYIDRDKLD
jgi:hypothetical protein